jgi:putative SOS response-associated peptidase YedK
MRADVRRMCGRFASHRPVDEIRALFGTVNAPPNTPPSWNVAPTREALVVRRHPESGARHLDLLRWGLIPHWTKDPPKTRQPINARAETLATSPLFREALARRRCLVPVDAFYEWQATERGKQPFAIARADGGMLALAGLWEGWRGPEGTALRTFTIVTTPANDALRRLHDRMPAVIEPAFWPLWLSEVEGDARALLRPSAAVLRVWPVSTRVNNVRNDGPELLAPV